MMNLHGITNQNAENFKNPLITIISDKAANRLYFRIQPRITKKHFFKDFVVLG